MTSITINSVSGLNFPYTVYVCNVHGMGCILLAVINTTVPAPVTLYLPSPFDSAPAVGIKIVTSDGCERFEVRYCEDDNKDFQDLEDFYFQDGQLYYFQ